MKTIMIVDDEPEVLQTVRSFLKNGEFDVVTVTTNREALELLEDKQEEEVDLILVDTPVPGSDRKGFFSMKPKSTMQSAGTDAFLQKPFTRDQLLEFIKKGM